MLTEVQTDKTENQDHVAAESPSVVAYGHSCRDLTNLINHCCPPGSDKYYVATRVGCFGVISTATLVGITVLYFICYGIGNAIDDDHDEPLARWVGNPSLGLGILALPIAGCLCIISLVIYCKGLLSKDRKEYVAIRDRV
ncbi:MAG: hypothetical protein K940chlam3_01040 [Chlamydiae bacterium]|nr:hypothetical protein [Chlamydiota bacterium]